MKNQEKKRKEKTLGHWDTGRNIFLGGIITYYQELKYPTISNMLDFFPKTF